MPVRTLLKAAAVGAAGVYFYGRLVQPRYSFAGKVAVVTGGSRGLGLEVARQLALEGAEVAICARDEAELDAARADLERLAATVFSSPCDVTDREAVNGFVAATLERFGRIDALFNVAGVIEVAPVELTTEADFDASVLTHLYGPRNFCAAVLPAMRRRRSGRIVNVASVGGRIPLPHALPYSAGKFALVGYSEGLGAEVAKDGITVTTVCPGMIRTGSPLNVMYKGQVEREYAWFATADATPAISIASDEAARRIVAACRDGVREAVFPFSAKAAVAFHGLFRNASLGLLETVGRLMPRPPADGSTQAAIGWNAESDRTPAFARRSVHAAAAKNNE